MLLGHFSDHIQGFFGYSRCTVLMLSCEGLHAWMEYALINMSNTSPPQNHFKAHRRIWAKLKCPYIAICI